MKRIIAVGVLAWALLLSQAWGATQIFQGTVQDASGVQGAWTTPTFAAGNFTASDSMTWTVEAADVVAYAYTIVNKVMTVAFTLNATTVGGTPSGDLKIAIPGGKTATKTMSNPVYVLDAMTRSVGYAAVLASGTTINIEKADVSNWSASTNQTHVYGQITFEIN